MSRVYLLHFHTPIAPGRHTCQHYIGSAKRLRERIKEHRAGRGARLTQVAIERGISFTVVRTWEGGRQLERQLKNRKNGFRLCPVCQGKPIKCRTR
jgi:GIY-YIG catalytic domain-containing protein